jgi:hypothetical protein
MMRTPLLSAVALSAAVSAAACSSSAPATSEPSASTPAPAAAPATTPTAPAAASTGGATNKIDMDAIFPAGPGRDLVLNNCQNCHTFVPIVVLQMEEAAWTRSSVDHRPRVSGLNDADFKTLYDYLKANFNPSHPVPKLPQALLDTWTGN